MVAGAITQVIANGVCKGLNDARIYNRCICWWLNGNYLFSFSNKIVFEIMATYVWCKQCHIMIAKELLHEDCEPRVLVTPAKIKKQMGIK